MSAFEDLLKRTLACLVGIWGKFHYVASLRDGMGKYEHWGFTRTHGEHSSQAAFAEAHSSLFSQILRAPLSELLEDVEFTASEMNLSPQEFLNGLRRHAEQTLPKNLAGGTLAHFNSVLDALSLVHSARGSLIRRAA